MIAAVHSPGGLCKTALVRAYAFAHAGHYAAGGTWELPCEGIAHLGRALARLADDLCLQAVAQQQLGRAITLGDPAKASDDQAEQELLAQLQALAEAHAAAPAQRLCARAATATGQAGDTSTPTPTPTSTRTVTPTPTPIPHLVSPTPPVIAPRLLLMLDTVDPPALLGAQALARLPQAPWLELLVASSTHWPGPSRPRWARVTTAGCGPSSPGCVTTCGTWCCNAPQPCWPAAWAWRSNSKASTARCHAQPRWRRPHSACKRHGWPPSLTMR